METTTKAEKVAKIAKVAIKVLKAVLFIFSKSKSKVGTIADRADEVLNP